MISDRQLAGELCKLGANLQMVHKVGASIDMHSKLLFRWPTQPPLKDFRSTRLRS